MKKKKRKSEIVNLKFKMKLAAGIEVESPECVGTWADGLVTDSPVERLATAAQRRITN